MDEKRRRRRKTTRMTTEVTSFGPAAGRVALRTQQGWEQGVPARRRRQHPAHSQNEGRQGAQLCVGHSLRAARADAFPSSGFT